MEEAKGLIDRKVRRWFEALCRNAAAAKIPPRLETSNRLLIQELPDDFVNVFRDELELDAASWGKLEGLQGVALHEFIAADWRLALPMLLRSAELRPIFIDPNFPHGSWLTIPQERRRSLISEVNRLKKEGPAVRILPWSLFRDSVPAGRSITASGENLALQVDLTHCSDAKVVSDFGKAIVEYRRKHQIAPPRSVWRGVGKRTDLRGELRRLSLMRLMCLAEGDAERAKRIQDAAFSENPWSGGAKPGLARPISERLGGSLNFAKKVREDVGMAVAAFRERLGMAGKRNEMPISYPYAVRRRS